VEHSSSLPSPQPWRSAALVAACVAAVELGLLLVLGFVFFGKYFAGEVEKATDRAAVVQAAVERDKSQARGGGAKAERRKPVLGRRETSVIVLNGNGVAGAAGSAAEGVRERTYVIAGTGNAPRSDFARSIVMYRPGFDREAARLARDAGVKRVAPLDGIRIRDLQGAHLALIVGG
jgi:hypothetical protein